jgi:hypothetical protein
MGATTLSITRFSIGIRKGDTQHNMSLSQSVTTKLMLCVCRLIVAIRSIMLSVMLNIVASNVIKQRDIWQNVINRMLKLIC